VRRELDIDREGWSA